MNNKMRFMNNRKMNNKMRFIKVYEQQDKVYE